MVSPWRTLPPLSSGMMSFPAVQSTALYPPPMIEQPTVSLVRFWLSALFLACSWPSSHCVLTRQKEKEVSYLFYKSTNSTMKGPPLWPHLTQITSQRSNLQTPSHWDKSSNTWLLWEAHKTSIHSTPCSNPEAPTLEKRTSWETSVQEVMGQQNLAQDFLEISLEWGSGTWFRDRFS